MAKDPLDFRDSVKEAVRRKANHTCCWCKDPKNPLEVHHIVPKSEKKNCTNDEGNAAPLCRNCHALIGGNDELRKDLRRRRDAWYEECERSSQAIAEVRRLAQEVREQRKEFQDVRAEMSGVIHGLADRLASAPDPEAFASISGTVTAAGATLTGLLPGTIGFTNCPNPSCGRLVTVSSNFCPSCGSRLD